MDFPSPISDDELLLNNALAAVMASYGDGGEEDRKLVREAEAHLLIEAYDQGVRDEEVLIRYATKAPRLSAA
jgi:hypothetical protein